MPRPIACSSCRQDKLRCDAFTVAPDPCTRCRNRGLKCSIDTSYRRTPTRSRLQHLAQEVQDLKESLSRTANGAVHNSSPRSILQDSIETGNSEHNAFQSSCVKPSDDGISAQLGDVVLGHSDIDTLFQEYFQRYHPLFPILDPAIMTSTIRRDCPTLFWSVITAASRSIRPELYAVLCDLIPHLISGHFFYHSYSVQPCQALLILCMFPLPINKSREDVRWIYSGMAMQMATLAGLHKTGSDHEYRKAGAVKSNERYRRELTRTWYCCCYVNATLSAEFGLPSLIPQDTLSMKDLNGAALPIEFVSVIRIALESTKISRVIDLTMSTRPSTGDNATLFGLLRMFEADLDVLGDSTKANETKLDSLIKFSLLMAKLNLYSFGLNQATKSRTPEAMQLRISAFTCTTILIQLFVDTSLLPPQARSNASGHKQPVQTFYPPAYWKGLLYACLALLKLSLTKSLPDFENMQSEAAIQKALDLIIACSMAEGDELHRAARLIRLLSQEAVQEILKPRHEVHSRMGASLMYELILSAVVWKKQKAMEQREDARASPHDQTRIENASWIDNTSSISDMSPQALEEWIASSGYPSEGMGAIGFDMNFWDTSAFEEFFTPNTAVTSDARDIPLPSSI